MLTIGRRSNLSVANRFLVIFVVTLFVGTANCPARSLYELRQRILIPPFGGSIPPPQPKIIAAKQSIRAKRPAKDREFRFAREDDELM